MGNCFGSRSSITPSFSESSKKFPKRPNIGTRDHIHKPDYGKAKSPMVVRESSDTAIKETTSVPTNDRAAKSSNDDGGKVITPNLKMFTLTELKKATRDFRPDTVVGEGGFGTVFKGWVDEKTYAPSKVGVGIAVAVKKSNPDSSQGLKEWQAEVKFLGKFSHPNLVKLLGYCWEENQFLLVYEYMQKGSLENHLFRKGSEPLSWRARLKIAIGAARGLSFLHNSEKSVIYRDFKTSNILLDGDFNAKLSDFGLAKFGPINGHSHVTTSIMGTYGYAAPEYVATGHLYLKSDVFGFGVVMLELLTGHRALDNNRPPGRHVLVDWAKPSLTEKKRLRKIMDPGLGDEYPIKGALIMADLILKCLEPDPKSRPSMELVLDTLETINTIQINTKNKNLAIDVQFHGKRHDECSSSTSSSSHANHRQYQYNSPHGKSPVRQKNGVSKAPHRRQAQ